MRPWLHSNTIFYNLSSIGKLEKKLLKIFHDFNNKILKSRSENYKEITYDEDDKVKNNVTMLDLLLKAKYRIGNLTDEEIQDEVSTIMFAVRQNENNLCGKFLLLFIF